MHGLLQALCVYRQPCPYTGLHCLRARRAASDQGHVARHQIPAGRRQHSGPPVHDGARNGRNGRGAPTGAGAPGAGACGGGRQRGRPPAPRCHTYTPCLSAETHLRCRPYIYTHAYKQVDLPRPLVREYVCKAAGRTGAGGARSKQLFVRTGPGEFRLATSASSPSV